MSRINLNEKPRYFCNNCDNFFLTGKFSKTDHEMYDDVCPYCGAIGLTFEELGKEYMELNKDYNKLVEKIIELHSEVSY